MIPKLATVFLVGVIVQTAGLTAFAYIANTELADVLKPAIYLAAGMAVAAIQWQVVRSSKARKAEFVLTPALLAIGFSLAYLIAGKLRFHLLLNGLDWSFDSLRGVARSTIWVLLLYGALMSVLLLVRRGWWGRGRGGQPDVSP
jgi:hypothetical protein